MQTWAQTLWCPSEVCIILLRLMVEFEKDRLLVPKHRFQIWYVHHLIRLTCTHIKYKVDICMKTFFSSSWGFTKSVLTEILLLFLWWKLPHIFYYFACGEPISLSASSNYPYVSTCISLPFQTRKLGRRSLIGLYTDENLVLRHFILLHRMRIKG